MNSEAASSNPDPIRVNHDGTQRGADPATAGHQTWTSPSSLALGLVHVTSASSQREAPVYGSGQDLPRVVNVQRLDMAANRPGVRNDDRRPVEDLDPVAVNRTVRRRAT